MVCSQEASSVTGGDLPRLRPVTALDRDHGRVAVHRAQRVFSAVLRRPVSLAHRIVVLRVVPLVEGLEREGVVVLLVVGDVHDDAHRGGGAEGPAERLRLFLVQRGVRHAVPEIVLKSKK